MILTIHVQMDNVNTTMKTQWGIALIALSGFFSASAVIAKDNKVPTSEKPSKGRPDSLATFGGGCFWCTEALLETLDGVSEVVSGYSGGHKANPTYKEVCAEITGHAEVVQVSFDSSIISFEELLSYFWQAHDPTTLNRQGNDVGTQYRSVILYHNATQKIAAEKSLRQAAASFRRPIVTQIVPFEKFYPAEAYHQDYFAKNPNQSYCYFVIRPKLHKFKKLASP